jgi:hypothetical protein
MDARTWNGLVKALRRTVYNEAMTAEELVHLRVSSAPNRVDTREFRGIQELVYKKPADIAALLRGELVSDLNPLAAAFVPKKIMTPSNADPGGDGIDEDEVGALSAPPAEEDSGIDHTLDLEAEARAVDARRVEQVAEPPTEDEIKAATYFAHLYRRKISRRQVVAKTGKEADRERYYQMYRERQWASGSNARYKVLFRGFVPHLLICLESYNTHVINSKKKTMLRRSIVPHHQYEAITAQIDIAMYVKLTLLLFYF